MQKPTRRVTNLYLEYQNSSTRRSIKLHSNNRRKRRRPRRFRNSRARKSSAWKRKPCILNSNSNIVIRISRKKRSRSNSLNSSCKTKRPTTTSNQRSWGRKARIYRTSIFKTKSTMKRKSPYQNNRCSFIFQIEFLGNKLSDVQKQADTNQKKQELLLSRFLIKRTIKRRLRKGVPWKTL